MWYIPPVDTTIDDLIKTSPVPVNFTSEIGESGVESAIRMGVFYFDPPRIEILSSLSDWQKLTTLIHEISHAKCHKEKCGCDDVADKSGAEIHAYRYTLEWLLKNKRRKTLRSEMKHLVKQSDREDYYGKVAKHIMKLELWQKCLKYVGKLIITESEVMKCSE